MRQIRYAGGKCVVVSGLDSIFGSTLHAPATARGKERNGAVSSQGNKELEQRTSVKAVNGSGEAKEVLKRRAAIIVFAISTASGFETSRDHVGRLISRLIAWKASDRLAISRSAAPMGETYRTRVADLAVWPAATRAS